MSPITGHILLILCILLLGYLQYNYGYLKFRNKTEHFRRLPSYDENDFTAYRSKIAEEIKRKELNRDFNFEVPMFYKTPFQYLDFQDLLINEYDNVYNASPEEIDSNLLRYR